MEAWEGAKDYLERTLLSPMKIVHFQMVIRMNDLAFYQITIKKEQTNVLVLTSSESFALQ